MLHTSGSISKPSDHTCISGPNPNLKGVPDFGWVPRQFWTRPSTSCGPSTILWFVSAQRYTRCPKEQGNEKPSCPLYGASVVALVLSATTEKIVTKKVVRSLEKTWSLRSFFPLISPIYLLYYSRGISEKVIFAPDLVRIRLDFRWVMDA